MSHLEIDEGQAQVRENGGNLDILLPTIGSAGDVHPVIELGSALKKRGHRATVITNQFFEQQAHDAGLEFAALGTVQEAEAIIANPRLWHPTKSFDCIAERAILRNIVPLYHIIRRAADREYRGCGIRAELWRSHRARETWCAPGLSPPAASDDSQPGG